jgi:hypothetical protein
MDAELQKKIFEFRDRCFNIAYDDKYDDTLDVATRDEATSILNFPVGPAMTYNQLLMRLDSLIRTF